MQFATVNGAVTHFLDEGPRDAPAVVFINSLGTDFRIWDDVARSLTGQYRVLLSDKRGHGLSQMRSGPATMADFAADLAALLDRLEIARANVVGLSIGGLIAQQLYHFRPDLVDSLILSDTAHRIGTLEFVEYPNQQGRDRRDRIDRRRNYAGVVQPILSRETP